jgi:hypothetical protein
MYEVGIGVIANPSSLQHYRRPAQQGNVSAGQTDVNGFPFYVLTIPGCYPITAAEPRIGGRGAIPRRNMKRLVSVQQLANGVEEIKQLGINRLDLVGIIITQEIVNILQGTR